VFEHEMRDAKSSTEQIIEVIGIWEELAHILTDGGL
jgi:hypothetical protein